MVFGVGVDKGLVLLAEHSGLVRVWLVVSVLYSHQSQVAESEGVRAVSRVGNFWILSECSHALFCQSVDSEAAVLREEIGLCSEFRGISGQNNDSG